jgi:hypothetical protein
MNTLKTLTLAVCLAASATMLAASGVRAETTADKPATAGTSTTSSTGKMSDAEKRAKAADCTKQANKKKLHGTERKEFREACKRK